MDHFDQCGILLGEGFQEVRIVGLQLGRQVRVANLQTDGEPTVALQKATFVAAFQGFVAFGLAGAENVAEFDRSSPLHFLHGCGQLSRREAPIVPVKIMTRSHLLPVAAFARYFDHFLAG